jgi:phosphatidylglycerophosphatase A
MQKQLKIVLGSGLGSGYLPMAPGTWGSLPPLVISWLLSAHFGWVAIITSVLIFSLITLWVSPYLEEIWGEDPGKLVMDEWAGQSLVFLFIPLSGDLSADILVLISAFILFRFFDILKPLGVRYLQKYPSGWGILLDDLLAGLYALISLNILIFYAL